MFFRGNYPIRWIRDSDLRRAFWSSKPEIFNTDQGVQLTPGGFIALLNGKEVKISMDGWGRISDNFFVERLWRMVKYEEIYLHEYLTAGEAKPGNLFLVIPHREAG